MVKKFLLMLVASVVIGAILSSVAFGEGTTTVSTPAFSSSPFAISVTNSSTATFHGSATLNGKLEVKAIMPHGIPKSWRKHCEWNDFAWSDWQTSSGSKVWAPPGHHGRTHACQHNGKWYQIGGGPGQWNCGNEVKPIGSPLPPHAVKVKMSEIVVVKEFIYTITVNIKAEAKQEASAMATCTLPNATAAASIHGSGLAEATISGTGKATSKSQALAKATAEAVKIADSKEATLFAEAHTEASVKLEGYASAFCSQQAQKTCTELGTCPPPPPTCTELGTCPPPSCTELGNCPPPEHWTSISCVGFEEVSGNGSFLVDCTVEDDNGAPISLTANANDGNSRVSGVNCYSNKGTPTCPNGGTFEFRVSGINDGSSILYSSVTAVASANGVPATFVSDPYPVDPSEGGF